MGSERFVRGDGVRLAVREWSSGPGTRRAGGASGADPPAILLLHGLASTSHIWDLVAPRLAGRHRVVAYDQRGHGRSGKPSSGYGFDRTTADAVAVIRGLGLRRPVVVGHSWGASVALQLAVREPRRVAGAVLLDGGFSDLRDRMDWPTARRVLAPPQIDGMPLERFLAWPRRAMAGLLDVTPQIEEVFRSLVRVDAEGRIHRRLSVRNHLKILHAMWAEDTVGALRRVRVPTLVLACRTAVPPAGEEAFQAAKRHAAETVRAIGGPVRFGWIGGIHDVPLQRPEAVARRIERFVREARA
ncbi:MAG: alpha/beta fold hydrolase [Candidatus Velamenicoccus archaeovorus]